MKLAFILLFLVIAACFADRGILFQPEEESKCWEQCKTDIREDVRFAKILIKDLQRHDMEKFKKHAKIFLEMLKLTLKDCMGCNENEVPPTLTLNPPEQTINEEKGPGDVWRCLNDIQELVPLAQKLVADLIKRDEKAVKKDLDVLVAAGFKAFDECTQLSITWNQLANSILSKECAALKRKLGIHLVQTFMYLQDGQYPLFFKHLLQCYNEFLDLYDVCYQNIEIVHINPQQEPISEAVPVIEEVEPEQAKRKNLRDMLMGLLQ